MFITSNPNPNFVCTNYPMIVTSQATQQLSEFSKITVISVARPIQDTSTL